MSEIRVKNVKFSEGSFDKLEEYLSEEHAKGRRFKKYERRTIGSRFVFEECEPCAVEYRIDCVKADEVKKASEAAAEDGWECVGASDGFVLYRTEKDVAADCRVISSRKEVARKLKEGLKTVQLSMFSLSACSCGTLTLVAANKSISETAAFWAVFPIAALSLYMLISGFIKMSEGKKLDAIINSG